MDKDVRNVCCLVVGIAATGTALALISRWASRSSAASAGVETGGGTYYERKLAQARRDQEQHHERALQDQERSYQQATELGEHERFERAAERRTGFADRVETRTARRAARDVERYGDPLEITADPALAGFLRVGNAHEQTELQAARKIEAAASDTRRSAKAVRVARGHDLKSAKAMRKAGGSKDAVKVARGAVKLARQDVQRAEAEEDAAEQDVRKERAEARAGRRQERAQEVEEGIETSVTDFQPDAPDERIYLSRSAVYE